MPTLLDNRITIVVGAFAAAWLLSRASAEVARRVLVWHDRRHVDNDPGETAKFTDVKRQETLVALIRTGIAYCGFVAAAVLTLAELIGGVDRLTAIAGASFLLILVGFAVQRVLTDIIAGFAMFAERWYAVGDTVAVSGLEVQGVVEDRLPSAHAAAHARRRGHPYPQLPDPGGEGAAARVKELAVELFVSDRERA